MPYGDGTGPLGYGPMTGRAAGYCAGYGAPGYINWNPGWGYGCWGRGRGLRRWAWRPPVYAPYAAYPYAAATAEQELEWLKNQADAIKASLDEINARIEELSKEKTEKL